MSQTIYDRQAIPVVKADDDIDIAIGAISTMLDAQLASRLIAHGQTSLLPSAVDFPIVDLAVRQWATLNKARIDQRARHSLHEDGTGIEVYGVFVGYDEIVSVHRPRELQEVETIEPVPGIVIPLHGDVEP